MTPDPAAADGAPPAASHSSAIALIDEGNALEEQRRVDEAMARYDAAVQADPRWARTHIRGFRQDVEFTAASPELLTLIDIHDFYSTRECRDLLFHVRESPLTRSRSDQSAQLRALRGGQSAHIYSNVPPSGSNGRSPSSRA